nr:RecName: Full=Glycoprotein gp2; AltName: Full=Glycoprotein X; Short=GpX [Equine herpesvirus type 1 (strain Kentucky D)]
RRGSPQGGSHTTPHPDRLTPSPDDTYDDDTNHPNGRNNSIEIVPQLPPDRPLIELGVATLRKNFMEASCTVETNSGLAIFWKIGKPSVDAFNRGTTHTRLMRNGVPVYALVSTLRVPWLNVIPLTKITCAACPTNLVAGDGEDLNSCTTKSTTIPCPGQQRTHIFFSAKGHRAVCITSELVSQPTITWSVGSDRLRNDGFSQTWYGIQPGVCGILRSRFAFTAPPGALDQHQRTISVRSAHRTQRRAITKCYPTPTQLPTSL